MSRLMSNHWPPEEKFLRLCSAVAGVSELFRLSNLVHITNICVMGAACGCLSVSEDQIAVRKSFAAGGLKNEILTLT
jgi:hypothetical protein